MVFVQKMVFTNYNTIVVVVFFAGEHSNENNKNETARGANLSLQKYILNGDTFSLSLQFSP